jgi:hypothetical protein
MKNRRMIKKDQSNKEKKSEALQECGASVDDDKKDSSPSKSLSRASKVINPLPDEKKPVAALLKRKELPTSLGSIKKPTVAKPPAAEKGERVENEASTSRRRSAGRRSVKKTPVVTVVKPPVVLQRERDENKAPTSRRSVKKSPVVKPPVVVLQREDRVQPAPASRRSVKKGLVAKPPVRVLQQEHCVRNKAPLSRRSGKKLSVVKPVVVLQREQCVQEKTPASRRSVTKHPVIKPPPGFLQREHHAQDESPVSHPSVQKTPVVKPVAVLQPRAGHPNIHDKVPTANTDKTSPGFFTKSKGVEPEADKVSAAWAHYQALSASQNENANTIPSVIFTNEYVVPDDAVSRLYYDPDIDDDDALPPATIAVLENFFDGIDSDLEETDDESSFSSSASEQDFFYSKTVPADYSPSYRHFDFGMMEV